MTIIIKTNDRYQDNSDNREVVLRVLNIKQTHMESMVVYDSNYGNTKTLAEVIAQVLGCDAHSVKDISDVDVSNLRLLVVGSPINAWRPTAAIRDFLDKLHLDNTVKAAAFDTRIRTFISGDAAKRIGKGLQDVGANLIVKPEGFYVMDNEGPFEDGEMQRAMDWANDILAAVQSASSDAA